MSLIRGPFEHLAKALSSVYPETVPCHNCGKEGKEQEMHRVERVSRNQATGVSTFNYACHDCKQKGVLARKEAIDLAGRKLYDPDLTRKVTTKPLHDYDPRTGDILKALGFFNA